MKKVIIPDLHSGQYSVDKSNRDWILEKGSALTATGTQGLCLFEDSTFSGNFFHINGDVTNMFMFGSAISLAGAKSNVTIGRSAEITASQVAISLTGVNQVLVNAGDISSGVYGIHATGAGKNITNRQM